MKSLTITNPHFSYLERSFGEWLSILGYADNTVKRFPVHLREYFHYLEEHQISHITQAEPRHIGGFLYHIEHRTNHNFGGGLSAAHINQVIGVLNLFGRFIRETTDYVLDIAERRMEDDPKEPITLSVAEIKALYEATYSPCRQNPVAFGQRDRAMLGVFYGCGLRKEEGAMLDVSDIDLHRKLVFVKKGKGGKQRYVPIAAKHAEDMERYLAEGREWFMEDHRQSGFHIRYGKPFIRKKDVDANAFLLTFNGTRMTSFYGRLEYLKEKAGIEKDFSTHTLRHSIATHLLASGMPIEEIAKFLGHSTLASTQLYTHITNKLHHDSQDQSDDTSNLLFS